MCPYSHFTNYYEERVKVIDENLSHYVKQYSNNSLLDDSNLLQYMKEPFINVFVGGKYLRGIMVCLGYEMFNKQFETKIIEASVAYEIFQTSILLKDDIIDDCNLRRGKKTLHKLFESYNNNKKKSEAMTICLSDFGYGIIYDLIINSEFDSDKKLLGIRSLIENINNTIMGQILDIELTDAYDYKNFNSEQLILEVAKYKTSFYTIIGPLSLGGILAGADDMELNLIRGFGENLGIAFQIQDDILGIYGQNLGKPTDSDIKEKKITILYDYTLKHASESDREYMENMYGNKTINEEQVTVIKEIIQKSGAVTYANKLKHKYKEKALEIYSGLKTSQKYRQIVNDAVEYLVDREK